MKKILNILGNGERYQTISVIVCLILAASFFGCQQKTESMLTPGKMITRIELDNEVEFILRSAESKAMTMQQQKMIQDILFQAAITTAKTGSFSYLPLITSLGTILGIGATVDNVRKRKEIKSLKTSP